MIAQLLILLVLFLIAYDDLRYRSVRVILFPILITLLVYAMYQQISLQEMAFNLLFNTLYISLLLGICCLYLWVRYRSIVLFAYLGLGDIFFLICLSIWFDPVQFILFNSVSFVAALSLHFLLSRFFQSYQKVRSVPLAGFQSLCFAISVIIGIV